MTRDKLIFKACTRQCITVIYPNNNSAEILNDRVFDSTSVLVFGKIVISEVWKTISAIKVIVSGAWKDSIGIKINISESWKEVQ